MLHTVLAGFYERDLRQLIDEVNLFRNEDDLWKTQGSIKNTSGNLVLHITGGLNFLIGTTLAQTGYVRNRDLEFSSKGIKRSELVAGLEELISLITKTLQTLTPKEMDTEYPILFDDGHNTVQYVLVQLLAHLNYHLGQVNYLRRALE